MKKILLLLLLTISFAMTGQTIQSVSPNTGTLGQTLLVTITGDNTNFTQVSDTYNVSFYNSLQQNFVVNAIQMVSNTELIANVTIPITNLPGAYDLQIYDPFTNGAYLSNAFNVTTTLNSISGNIKLDSNANGCDASDAPAGGIRVNLSDGSSDRITFTNAAGDYIFYVPAGNYVISPQIQTTLFSFSPTSANFNFATTNNLSETQGFCLAPNGVYNDVNVSLLPLTVARPGFNATYRLVYKNAGNQIMNGTINFVFDDSRLDVVSSTAAPTSQTVNNLTWDYVSLMPFETRTITIVLNVNSPQETPAVNIGDVFNFSATVNPVSGDETPNDNTVVFNQTVVGAIDPNDKAVVEGSEILVSDVDKYLNYIIRFQNSGNFAAEFVRVQDMLASNLDKSTLQVTSASHPYRATLTSGNKLEFFFDNINLPPENIDEAGSNGFIAFKIKPSNTVGLGSVMENTAEIYFDYNWPIVTNTVTTTVTLLATSTFDSENEILIYPNPVGDVLNFETKTSTAILSAKIFNQLGQLVKTVSNIDGNQINTVEVADLVTGTYFVKITSDKGTSVKKLIKK